MAVLKRGLGKVLFVDEAYTVRIMRISGSNNDQLGDTQAILEAQLDETIGDVGDACEGCRVKALIKPH